MNFSQRQNVNIGRIQKFVIDERARGGIKHHSVIAQRAGLYTEFRNYSMDMIFTFKAETAQGDVGDPVMIFVENKFNISDVLANNNVVVSLPITTMIFTFPDESEAGKFCKILRARANRNVAVSIPPSVQNLLQTTYL